MRSLLAIVSMLFVATVAQAQNTEFIFYHPPGGGADTHSRGLITALEQQGVTVKRTYVKSCAEAITYVENNPGSVMVSLTADLRYSDSARCPSIDRVPKLKLYSSIADTSFVYCTAPKRRDLDLAAIAASKDQLLVAVPTIDANWIPFNLFAKNQKNPANLKLVPYKGGGDLKTAVLAGNVDLFYVGTVKDLLEQGARCLAASTRKNPYGLPFLGDLTTVKVFPETALTTTLWYSGNLDPAMDKNFRRAFASRTFQEHLQANSLSHNGIGAGVLSETTLKNTRALDELFFKVK
jgi:tripartite-type tricarboxylate transporter receptor subunit TctC